MRLAKSQAHQPFPGFFGPGFFLSNHRCKSLFQSVCPDSNRAFSLFGQMHSASALFHFKKGAGSSACICRPEQDRSGLIFYTREELYEHQRKCVPDLDERIRQQEEALEQVAQEQTM